MRKPNKKRLDQICKKFQKTMQDIAAEDSTITGVSIQFGEDKPIELYKKTEQSKEHKK